MLVPAAALILGYTFLLKMMSHMQSRLGPMDPGGFHGWFQLVGDGIKFIQKEDITPLEADRRVFAFAPAVVVMSTFLVFLVIPAGPDVIVKDLNVGVFYALAVSSLSVVGVLMAGWASANKFSLLGALRAAAQLIAYELPLLLAVVGVVIQAGTMSLQGIVLAQHNGEIFGWSGFGSPVRADAVRRLRPLPRRRAGGAHADPLRHARGRERARRRLHGRVHRAFGSCSSSSASSARRSRSPPSRRPCSSVGGPFPVSTTSA